MHRCVCMSECSIAMFLGSIRHTDTYNTKKQQCKNCCAATHSRACDFVENASCKGTKPLALEGTVATMASVTKHPARNRPGVSVRHKIVVRDSSSCPGSMTICNSDADRYCRARRHPHIGPRHMWTSTPFMHRFPIHCRPIRLTLRSIAYPGNVVGPFGMNYIPNMAQVERPKLAQLNY